MATESRRSRGLAALLVALALLDGCGPPGRGELLIECHILPEPPHVGPADLRIVLFDRYRHAVPGARFSIEADMAHPGMKPVFAEAHARDGGYVSKLNFDMPGDWTLLIHAKLANGLTVENQFPVTVREK